jgi:uncharacterized membrane protein YphA (DoxX/SURF4 family)
MNLPIPPSVIYAGCAGVLFALLVATAQQKWRWKVFFLLALRLAIGWQFLFEGLNKIQSHMVGPIEGNRPFSSEPYFKEAPGPLAGMMRSMNGDPATLFAKKLTPAKEMSAVEFAKLTEAEQAALCPEAVAKEFDDLSSTAAATLAKNAETALKALPANREKSLKVIAETEEKETLSAKDDAGKAAAKNKAEAARKAAEAEMNSTQKSLEETATTTEKIAGVNILNAKAAFARWIYGVDRRDIKMARISGDVSFTAPQRLHYLGLLKKEKELAESKLGTGMGGGYGIDVKKAQSSRADFWNAESELVKDTEAFITELKTSINDGKAPEKLDAMKEIRERSFSQIFTRDGFQSHFKSIGNLLPTERNDLITRWFLAIVGACILAGLFTRLSCVLAAGFLLLTYLTHPPFPWYTLPPGTEGNPLFINKNAIEFFALLALAGMRTGQWLGLDAIISYVFGGRKKKAKTTTTTA